VVIESFLISTDYLETQLKGVKRAPVLASFLDHVLRVNATNWLQSKPFMDITSIKALWDPWWAVHRGEAKSEPEQQNMLAARSTTTVRKRAETRRAMATTGSVSRAARMLEVVGVAGGCLLGISPSPTSICHGRTSAGLRMRKRFVGNTTRIAALLHSLEGNVRANEFYMME
jgi:hypothetical protein